LNVRLGVVEVRAIGDLKGAFATAGEAKPDAIIIQSSPHFGTNPGLIADLRWGSISQPRSCCGPMK
jgi:hypothetical protein